MKTSQNHLKIRVHFLIFVLVPLLSVFSTGAALYAQEKTAPETALSPAEQNTHNALRKVKDEMTMALNKSDLPALLKHVHPDVVFTGMNGEVARGKPAVQKYFARMMSGPNRVVKEVKIDLTVDTLTILHGTDTGIAYGYSIDSYKLSEGMDFEVKTRWTATMVREGGAWYIAGFHSSANIFENPLLTKAQNTLIWAGLAGVLLGLLIGFLAARFLLKKG